MQSGRTALHWAAKSDTLEIVSLILSAGATVDVTDKVSRHVMFVINPEASQDIKNRTLM